MKIREILPENWWKDLDPGFLSMMGYTTDNPVIKDNTDLVQNISQDIKKIRHPR